MTDPDDAPLDRTDERATKADLFDTAQWLGLRLGAVRDEVNALNADSTDITDRIMGDLAGLRSEQIHLARRLETLSAELRVDIRKELRNAGAAEAGPGAHDRAGRRAGALMTILIVTFLLAMLMFLGLALLPAFGLVDWIPAWLVEWLAGQGR